MISNSSDNNSINQNIEAVLDFYAREDDKMSTAQRVLDRVSCFIGEPIFIALILLFVVLWIACNSLFPIYLIPQFDPPPFHFLQGVIGLSALLTATIVVSNQNRLAKIDEQRVHLDLKINLLTEQKTAKLINLLEELRFDLPNVKNRQDFEAAELKHAMNPGEVLAALDERTDLDASLQTDSTHRVVDIDGHKIN